MLNPKVGDMVRVSPLKVERVEPGIFVVANGVTLHISFIEEILPRPLQVGDLVNGISSYHHPGAIKAIDGNIAWVRWDDGAYSSFPLESFSRYEPS